MPCQVERYSLEISDIDTNEEEEGEKKKRKQHPKGEEFNPIKNWEARKYVAAASWGPFICELLCVVVRRRGMKEKAPLQVAKGLMEMSLRSRIFSARETALLCIARAF